MIVDMLPPSPPPSSSPCRSQQSHAATSVTSILGSLCSDSWAQFMFQYYYMKPCKLIAPLLPFAHALLIACIHETLQVDCSFAAFRSCALDCMYT